MQTSLRVAGAGPGPVVPMVAGAVPGGRDSVRAYACCCAVNLLGGDGGEAIAVDDADLELGGSPETASRLAVCLWSRDSLLGDHGAVVVDADLQGSEWKNFDWLVSIFAGRPYAGGRSRRRRGLGWQCPKKQTGSLSSVFPSCDS